MKRRNLLAGLAALPFATAGGATAALVDQDRSSLLRGAKTAVEWAKTIPAPRERLDDVATRLYYELAGELLADNKLTVKTAAVCEIWAKYCSRQYGGNPSLEEARRLLHVSETVTRAFKMGQGARL